MIEKDNAYLSKSLFIRGLQCHKSLYLHKHHPELKDEVSAEQEARFSTGKDVGRLAQQLFPGGVEIPYEGLSHSEQINRTSEEIKKGKDTIYEATFSHDGVYVRVDILHKGSKGWEIYEVKSSASVKDVHFDDAAIQYYVVKGAGLPVSNVFLTHINNEYVRKGDIDPNGLFLSEDITAQVLEKQPFIPEELEKIRTMLKGRQPKIHIGPYCSDPYPCDFTGHCWSHIPSPSVFDFMGRGKPDAFGLYQQGIVRMEDVPPELLGWQQQMQLNGTLYRKNHIDGGAVKEFVRSLWFPLCFLDFETTAMIPIPMYDGIRPYQQVPFQYSLHIIGKPGSETRHHEFLADGSTNPQRALMESLLSVVPKNSCIATWNQSFEIGRLRDLAVAFPERSGEINAIIGNIRDLMIPFRDKLIYHWQFNGSFSIKAVLPALVPDLSYDNLELSDGEMASAAWVRMIQSKDDREKAIIRQQLLEYCNLDTWAMVRILEEMKRLVGA
jgi:hypothetical protein